MSVSDKEISHVSSRAGLSGSDDRNDMDDEAEDGDEDGSGVNAGGKYEIDGDQKKVRRNGYDGFGKNIRKATQVVQLRFTNAKKKLTKISNNNRGSSASASSGAMSATLRSSGKRSKSIFHSTGQSTAGFQGCYFCFSQPNNQESPGGSQTSDPEGPNFTNAMAVVGLVLSVLWWSVSVVPEGLRSFS